MITGDSDGMSPGAAFDMFRLQGGRGVRGHSGSSGQLGVLPGTTHFGMIDRTAWMLPMIEESLQAPGSRGGTSPPSPEFTAQVQ